MKKVLGWGRHKIAQVQIRRPRFLNRERSALSYQTLVKIQDATMRSTYRGRVFWKNPFDIALYIRLIEQVRPATIIEIGSFNGGSALWFASQCRAIDLHTQVFSVDIAKVELEVDANVHFLQGDIHHLQESMLPKILETCERPLLVVEDGPHTYEGSLSALRFFDSYIRSGEYIVVEDGIVSDLRVRNLKNGPNRAIKEFLKSRPNAYKIDREFCDFYGRNVTWNTNGFLVKS